MKAVINDDMCLAALYPAAASTPATPQAAWFSARGMSSAAGTFDFYSDEMAP